MNASIDRALAALWTVDGDDAETGFGGLRPFEPDDLMHPDSVTTERIAALVGDLVRLADELPQCTLPRLAHGLAQVLRAGADETETSRPPAKYVPPTPETDTEVGRSAVLECPRCGGNDFYEVDRAIRWTEVQYGISADPRILTVSYGDNGDYESDHLRCDGCGTECEYPPEWSRYLSEW